MSRLAGKRIVIIGGTSGMGRGTAMAAIAEGAEVIIAGRRALAERPVIAGIDHEIVDVAEEPSVIAMFERIGPFDHLVVTAAPAPGSSKRFLDDTVAGAAAYLDAKVLGSWAAARYGAPRLRPGGSITFVTGGLVAKPKAGAAIVAAAFAAVETMARALAIELGPLRVNVIRPGYTDSEMWSFLEPAARDALHASVAAKMPTRRIGTVEDFGEAAVFAMTSRQLTGAVLELTGGETLVDL